MAAKAIDISATGRDRAAGGGGSPRRAGARPPRPALAGRGLDRCRGPWPHSGRRRALRHRSSRPPPDRRPRRHVVRERRAPARRLVEAMATQAMELSTTRRGTRRTTPPPTSRFASPATRRRGLDHVFFTTGGSSAVETALRFMQFRNNVIGRPEKKLIVSVRAPITAPPTSPPRSTGGRATRTGWTARPTLVVKLSCPNPFRRPAGVAASDFTRFLVEEFETLIAAMAPTASGPSWPSRSWRPAG